MYLWKVGKESTTRQSPPIHVCHPKIIKISYHICCFPSLCTVTAPTFPTQDGDSSASKIIQGLLSFCINWLYRLNLGPSQIHSFSFHEIFSPVLHKKSNKGSAGWGHFLVSGAHNYAAGEMKLLSSTKQEALKKSNADQLNWEGKGQSSVSRFFNRNLKLKEVQTMDSGTGQIHEAMWW